MSLAAGHPLLILLTWRTEDTPGLAGAARRSQDLAAVPRYHRRRMRCSTISSARRPISTRSRRIFFATPARFRSSSKRSPGNSSIAASSKATPSRFAAKAPWDALEIPPTVQGVIASRIDRLSKEDKALLQLASVVGPRISPALLAAVTGMPAAQLQSRLWSLEILDFLVESQWLAAPEYEFAHDLIREVAYDFDPAAAARGAAPADFGGSGGDFPRARTGSCRSALSSRGARRRTGRRPTITDSWRRRRRSPDRRSGMPRDISRFAMDAVDKLPASTAREQRAIDLRIEARLAFAVARKHRAMVRALSRRRRRVPRRSATKARRLASIADQGGGAEFLWNAL